MITDDVQSQTDFRRVEINNVGVKNLKYPIIFFEKTKVEHHTVGLVNMSVNLPEKERGTHMSRFLEVFENYRRNISEHSIIIILQDLVAKLNASSATLELSFPLFIEQLSPSTQLPGLMDIECWFKGMINESGVKLISGIRVPVTNLCPCSKSISEYGAHNQRGSISIEARSFDGHNSISFFELVEYAVNSASCPVYSILKRDDERFVTMKAYDNPRFVEDVIREVALQLNNDNRICWYKAEAINYESIHNHDAFAQIEREKQI